MVIVISPYINITLITKPNIIYPSPAAILSPEFVFVGPPAVFVAVPAVCRVVPDPDIDAEAEAEAEEAAAPTFGRPVYIAELVCCTQFDDGGTLAVYGSAPISPSDSGGWVYVKTCPFWV
jgi:hypothetical protein